MVFCYSNTLKIFLRSSLSFKNCLWILNPKLWSLYLVIVVQLLSCVWLFATLWITAHQGSVSFIIFWSLLKFMSIELVMITIHPLLHSSHFTFSLAQHQGIYQWVGSSHQVTKILELQLHYPSSEYLGLIPFGIDWLDLLAVQGTLKSLLQHHNLKASILWHCTFFIYCPTLTSTHDYWKNHSFDYMDLFW